MDNRGACALSPLGRRIGGLLFVLCMIPGAALPPAVSAEAMPSRCDARSLPPPTSAYKRAIARVNERLGIPEDYGERAGLEIQVENRGVVPAWIDEGQGVFFLSSEARDAWYRMNAAAMMDGVVLTLISAYRPVERQIRIIRERLSDGQPIADILETSAAPGYSEHHTGDAIDLNTNGTEPFSRDFAETDAYQWLQDNASRFCFELSYPEDNGKEVRFEPWHWRFRSGD